MTKYPNVNFAVISDLHFYDSSLGDEGAAFEQELSMDRKMLVESEELLDHMIEDLLDSDIKFLMVCGDLTKDGEAVNHKKLSAKLQVLVNRGIKVTVTPGNHDINNYGAARFSGSVKDSVSSISAEGFKKIYGEMGYRDALMSDSNSLSYVSEPIPGLWVLAIDSCCYNENSADRTLSTVGGRIKKSTAQWLTAVLEDAKKMSKPVIAFLHHGLIEHWDGQLRLDPDSLIENHRHIGQLLATNDVRFVFTGHNHAQSIAQSTFSKKYLCEVGTGSLITYPCPIRYCNLSNNSLTISTETLAEKMRLDSDFLDAAINSVKDYVHHVTYKDLLEYRLSDADAGYISNALGEAFVAHYSGNADMSLNSAVPPTKLSIWGRIVFSIHKKYVIDPLWKSASKENNHTKISIEPEFANKEYYFGEKLFMSLKKFIFSYTFEKAA